MKNNVTCHFTNNPANSKIVSKIDLNNCTFAISNTSHKSVTAIPFRQIKFTILSLELRNTLQTFQFIDKILSEIKDYGRVLPWHVFYFADVTLHV